MPNKYEKHDLIVSAKFISKFAEMYVQQRTALNFDINSIDNQFYFERTGFDTKKISDVIKGQTVSKKFITDKKGDPHRLSNIYRSDLGELLMTYFFEDKLESDDQFIIPLKNISNRELADLPGRGLDAVGYRLDNEVINVLIGEAKVSADKLSPPGVVDKNDDCIYNTQLKYKRSKDALLAKLSDYCRKLSADHATVIGTVITCMEYDIADCYTLTFGCCLVRDHECVNEIKDFGLLKDNHTEFDPYSIHFPILSFSDDTINGTVTKFFEEVQKLVTNN